MNTETYIDLEAMWSVDIRTVDPATLTDIRDIDISPDLPFAQKALDYLDQAGNAYCFRCGEVTIKISYSKTATTIGELMEGFFQTL